MCFHRILTQGYEGFEYISITKIHSMNTDKQISTDDNMNNQAHYSKNGTVTREDDRDKNKPDEDWDAEKSRTGRHK